MRDGVAGPALHTIRLACFLAGALVVGCADDRGDYERITSSAFNNHLDTRLGRLFDEAATQMLEKWEMAGFRAEVASVSVRFRPIADVRLYTI